ncbi:MULTISPECIES: hypothetical protein [Shewanella]|uniref:Uncharacterized protein n=1 Tax=Shewanella marisflavi TaxID=260364 RepID=A0ABX5WU19_9GAMM|nr:MULTISPECIES: hypothetical protein [Shewanella]QDF76651.1 hypothetical protein FGA12_16595 [Shewanella marisflavi]
MKMIWPFRKKEYTDEELLNEAFHLAMAWGKDWLQPVQGRLAKAHPQLTEKELDHYNFLVQEAMKFGHDQVYSMAEIHGRQTSEKEFAKVFSSKFPWANGKNISHCFNQGMYYAWKDMGLN